MTDRIARRKDESRGRLQHLIYKIKIRNNKKRTDTNLLKTKLGTKIPTKATDQIGRPTKANKREEVALTHRAQTTIPQTTKPSRRGTIGTDGPPQSRNETRIRLTQHSNRLGPIDNHPTQDQEMNEKCDTRMRNTITNPCTQKEMIARHIKASYLEIYSDTKKEESESKEKTHCNTGQ